MSSQKSNIKLTNTYNLRVIKYPNYLGEVPDSNVRAVFHEIDWPNVSFPVVFDFYQETTAEHQGAILQID